MPQDAATLIALHRAIHDDFGARVSSLDAAGLRTQSYCTEWKVADVLSHLGSGAVINLAMLDALVAGTDIPGQEANVAVWDEWNAKSPEDQAAGFVEADEKLVARWESLDEATLAGLYLERFGMQLDAVGLLAMRLNEVVLHGWDVDVAFDDQAALREDAVPALLDRLPGMAARTAKPAESPLAGKVVAIRTTAPASWFKLDVGDPVSMVAVGGAPGADDAVLAAEALVRLVNGRLDSDHVPDRSDVDDDLLALFAPG